MVGGPKKSLKILSDSERGTESVERGLTGQKSNRRRALNKAFALATFSVLEDFPTFNNASFFLYIIIYSFFSCSLCRFHFLFLVFFFRK